MRALTSHDTTTHMESRPMKTLRLLLALAALAAVPALIQSPAFATDQVPGAPQEAPVLLRGGDLYTVSGGVLEATDLLFADGKITAIGKGLEAPAGAEILDVAGHRIYPGLIAPGTALGLTEIGAVRATNDTTEAGNVTPEVRSHVAFNPDTEHIPTVRSNGITTAQVAPSGRLITGQSFVTHLDGWTKEDAAVRMDDGIHLAWPRAQVVNVFFLPPPEIQKKRMAEERKALREAFDAARAYHRAKRAGAEIEHDTRWEAMLPLFDGTQRLYVWAGDYRQILEAVAFAEDYGLEMVLANAGDADMVADLLLDREIPVILGAVQAIPTGADAPYDEAFRKPAMLHEAGVPFCFSYSSFGGSWSTRNLPFQAAQAVAFGLPEDVALASLTLRCAEILGIAERQGSLEVGKDATLFVSSGDVLDVLGNDVTDMWIEGRRVDLDDRHKRLYRKYDQKTYQP